MLEEVHQGEDHNLFEVKGDEKDMLQQLEIDGFNFEDVDWGDLNLLDNEIMSSTDAIGEWGIESSTLGKRINDFAKGSIVKLARHMLWRDLECAVLSVRIRNK